MKILFVCTGNTCSSPMAQVVAETMFGCEFTFASAGIGCEEGNVASENAQIVVQEKNMDLSGHKTQKLTQGLIEGADMVLTMSNGQKQAISALCTRLNTPVFTLVEYANEAEEIADPSGCGADVYRNVLETIETYLEKIREILK